MKLSTLAALFLLATRAAAQGAQYWDIQYGPVSQLLSGTVVDSTRDLSATYYNPGGLALGEDPHLLLTVQAGKGQTLTTEPVDGGQVLDLSDTEWTRFPGFVAVAFPECWLGERTRLAFSFLTRQQGTQRVDHRFTGIDPASGGPYGLETLDCAWHPQPLSVGSEGRGDLPAVVVDGDSSHLRDGRRWLLVLGRAEAEVVENATYGTGVGDVRNQPELSAAFPAGEGIGLEHF
jgi:hypothetical protein